jgi:ATP-dependent Clp protease ATP-binding subunit ClpC
VSINPETKDIEVSSSDSKSSKDTAEK